MGLPQVPVWHAVGCVCVFVIENSNQYHKGFEQTFIQIIQEQKEQVAPAWDKFKMDTSMDETSLPANGDASYYSL